MYQTDDHHYYQTSIHVVHVLSIVDMLLLYATRREESDSSHPNPNETEARVKLAFRAANNEQLL